MNEEQVSSLEALVAKLGRHQEPIDPFDEVPEDGDDPLVSALVFSMLLWDASIKQARNAMGRIRAAVVNLNELRIGFPDETAVLLGPRYPKVMERSERIRAGLNDLFRREQGLLLAPQPCEQSKRDARAYLESLEGVPRFAASRVALLGLEIHAIPCDTRLASRLAEHGILDAGADPDDASGQLERAIRATDARSAYLLLEAWSDSEPSRAARGGSTRSSKSGAARTAGATGKGR